jgi:predicted nuclease of predicted toxin-antitoxin system
MKRILLDQGLSPMAAAILRSQGWDAIHVSEIGLSLAEDNDILAFAISTNRTCITLDHDFHTHLALFQSSGPSVVFVRVEGMKAAALAALIESVWRTCEQELEDGAAVSVDKSTIRVRKLPLR